MEIDKYESTEPMLDKLVKELPQKKEKITGKFIPSIPFDFFIRAASISGKALAVFLYIWYISKLRRSQTIKLSNKALQEFGIHRMTKLRVLKKLVEAGLIKIEPKKEGSAHIITLITN